jgi:acetyltransferase
LDAIFRTRSVAIVGASTHPDCVGRQILDNLLEFGYGGRVCAVNPKARTIRGLRCYPSVREIEEPPESAVLVVPRKAVLPVVDDCLARGVGGLVVVSGGFRELDSEGACLETELHRRVAEAGIPLLGPNCMGLFNADPAVRLNLTFSPVQPRPGHIAFLSQSGALAAAVLRLAENSALGFSLFASLGNEAGLTHRDLLAYAAADPLTRVIVLYLETFENPQAFLRVAQQATRSKPVVCLKGGRTETGARAAASHTGALATSTRAFEAVLRQSGVVLVDTTEDMLNVALGFARVPLPRGRRVRVLTNAGGPGVLATDQVARRGLKLPPLAAKVQEELREFATPQAPLSNPVDLTVEGTPRMYGSAARLLLEEPATDALLFIFVEPPRVRGAEVLRELQLATSSATKPVVAAFPAQEELHRRAPEGNFALVGYPESAAAVLSALVQYSEWKMCPRGRRQHFAANRQRVAKLIEQARRAGRRALDPAESLTVLRAYGIPVARTALVRTAAELTARAQQIGFPLALKVVSPEILHKTEVGGVMLNISSPAALKKAYRTLTERLRAQELMAQLRGVLLQEMVGRERELILGFRRDAQGTPLLVVGLGGILVEALDAVAVRVLPVTDQDVREMLREMPGARALGQFRGRPPVAITRLEESLLRLAQLATDFSRIAEIDVNPFVVSARPTACKAVDARILLES